MWRGFGRWVERQRKDLFVRKAKVEGFRSRAAYKLIEMNDLHRFLRPGLKVIDLGAAPGGWSQVAAKLVESKDEAPSVLAVDILPITPISGVSILTLDVSQPGASEHILQTFGSFADVLLCDMSGNHTGDGNLDCGVTIDLTMEALKIGHKVLRPGSVVVMKVFSGLGEPDHFTYVRSFFEKLERVKPDASRSESREQYYFGHNWLLAKRPSKKVSSPLPSPPVQAEEKPISVEDVIKLQNVFVCDNSDSLAKLAVSPLQPDPSSSQP